MRDRWKASRILSVLIEIVVFVSSITPMVFASNNDDSNQTFGQVFR